MNNSFNMKRFQLIIIFLIITSTLKAQQILPQQKNDLDLMKKLLNQNFQFHKNLKDAKSKNLLALNDEQEPIFLYETERGKVYASPIDNMRYLSPKFHSNMPVYKKSPEIYIPNTLKSKK